MPLIVELGLRTIPARLDTAPLCWRLPDRSRVSRVPPIPVPDLVRLARAWWARGLHPDRPWHGPVAQRLDATNLADWLAEHGASPRAVDATEALIGA